ncbi:MAG: alpha/beta hydrolase [Rhodobacteraceae bacterium]|nr:alpha/beta hydrolase [Paracoccaceae bacterium]
MSTDFGIDWDDAFANAPYIAGAEGYPAKWAAQAQRFRDSARTASLDIAYGPDPRARLDLFRPDNARPRGLVIFVHGGFWKAFDKSVWSHLARGPLAQGWAVAMPSYTLAPEARIPRMTAQIAQAVALSAAQVDGPIHLVGHSAGGHLVTRMICADTALPISVTRRIGHVLSISGLHDLRPLCQSAMNQTLRLDAGMARAESPVLHRPALPIPVTCWVGSEERPEFLRQSALLHEAWRTHCPSSLHLATGLHHFNVIEGLEDPDSALTRCLLQP